MIRVKDSTNILPELFSQPGFVKVDQRLDAELYRTYDEASIEASDVFTVFVNREPDIHTAHIDFQELMYKRPHHVFLTAAWSNTQNWQVNNINFCSNMVATARSNPNVPMVSLSQKKYNALCLFGGSLFGKNDLFYRMQDLCLLDSCLVNIQRRYDQVENYVVYRSPDLDHLDNPHFVKNAFDRNQIFNSMKPVDHNTWLSQLVVFDLYEQCYIDVVTETAALHPDLFYISEKLSKSLLVGMPFLVFGCKNFLQYLTELGFKTYSNWLDESYDSISDNVKRAQAVAESLYQFSKKSERSKLRFLHECRSTTEHNRQLIKNFAHWLKPVVAQLKEQCKSIGK